jgi:hypothetical protein
MVAPHFHETKEAVAAIKRIEHNSGEAGEGAPTGIAGGSVSNMTTMTKNVTPTSKEQDWVSHRGIRSTDGAGRGN